MPKIRKLPKCKSLNRIMLTEIVQDVTQLPRHRHVKRSTAYRAVNAMLAAMRDALLRGESVKVPGFGTFRRAKKKGYMSMEYMVIKGKRTWVPTYRPAKYYIQFLPSDALKEFVDKPIREAEEANEA